MSRGEVVFCTKNHLSMKFPEEPNYYLILKLVYENKVINILLIFYTEKVDNKTYFCELGRRHGCMITLLHVYKLFFSVIIQPYNHVK